MDAFDEATSVKGWDLERIQVPLITICITRTNLKVSGATHNQLRDRESVFVACIVSLGDQEPESRTLEKIGCIYADISPAEVDLDEDHKKGWMLSGV